MTVAPLLDHLFMTTGDADAEISLKPLTQNSTLMFMGGKYSMEPGPTGKLVFVAPGREVVRHFHRVDQFQVMFGAPGSYYQRHEIPSLMLHYADAYSVYGPLGAHAEAPKGFKFFTLRAEPSDFAGKLPKDRDQLLYRGKRRHEIDVAPVLASDPPPAGGAKIEALIGPEADGLAAYVARIAPEAEIVPPSCAETSGRYTVVVEGNLQYGGRDYGVCSLGWSPADAPELTLKGGPEGCTALFLYLPHPATSTVRLASAHV